MYKNSILGVILLTLTSFAIDTSTKVSWYGPGFHGRITANGEIYDQECLTAASPDLPFNTLLLVTNLSNNKIVMVRINDRGPYKMHSCGSLVRPLKAHPVRGLDLSKAAFRKIANLDKGVINVKYEILCDL